MLGQCQHRHSGSWEAALLWFAILSWYFTEDSSESAVLFCFYFLLFCWRWVTPAPQSCISSCGAHGDLAPPGILVSPLLLGDRGTLAWSVCLDLPLISIFGPWAGMLLWVFPILNPLTMVLFGSTESIKAGNHCFDLTIFCNRNSSQWSRVNYLRKKTDTTVLDYNPECKISIYGTRVIQSITE